MKAQLWVLGLLSLVIAMPASAHPITYTGTLSNVGEPTPAEQSVGTGTATVIFDDDNFTMRVIVDFSDLTGTTTASHIHCCTTVAGSGSAGVATPVPSFPGFPTGVQAGTFDATFDLTQDSSWNPAFVSANGGSVGSAFAAFATGLAAGKAYLNIHTSFVGGGEIRAFLKPVPLPAALWLLAPAIGGLGLMRRKAV